MPFLDQFTVRQTSVGLDMRLCARGNGQPQTKPFLDTVELGHLPNEGAHTDSIGPEVVTNISIK